MSIEDLRQKGTPWRIINLNVCMLRAWLRMKLHKCLSRTDKYMENYQAERIGLHGERHCAERTDIGRDIKQKEQIQEESYRAERTGHGEGTDTWREMLSRTDRYTKKGGSTNHVQQLEKLTRKSHSRWIDRRRWSIEDKVRMAKQSIWLNETNHR